VIKTDVVVVGAGPCGLFQVFELGLLGLKAEIIDTLRQPGGQCTELYPDKPIYDIPAIPMCTGDELTEALLKQIEPFNAGMHYGEEVSVVERIDDELFRVETAGGKKFETRAVVIAGGVGSFQPRPIRVTDAENYTGKTLHYRVRDPQQFAGKKIAVLGGGDSALDWAVELAPAAEHLTLVPVFEKAKATAFDGSGDTITGMTVQATDCDPVELEVDHVLVFFGLAPKLGPIAEWGLDINRKTINVDTEKFETSEPGIYAVGDINFYPGKKKLILCGFHEAGSAGRVCYQVPNRTG